MSWRRLHLVLFLILLVVGLLRLATGNIVGALFALLLCTLFGAVAFDYPLLKRLRQLWRLLRRLLR